MNYVVQPHHTPITSAAGGDGAAGLRPLPAGLSTTAFRSMRAIVAGEAGFPDVDPLAQFGVSA